MLSHNLVKKITLMTYFFSLMSFLSSTNWFFMWIFLEVNMMTFIPLMYNNSHPSHEMISQYFLIQAFTGSLILFFMLLTLTNLLLFFSNLLLISSFCLKMGLPPFHFWLIFCSENLNYMNFFILNSFQKIIPLIFIQNNLSLSHPSIFTFLLYLMILNTLICSLACINEISFRKILAFSSLNHITWILLSISTQTSVWFIYMLNYIITLYLICYEKSKSHLNSLFSLNFFSKLSKLTIFFNLLNFSGMPPFLGFFPKILILNSFNWNFLLTFTILSSSLLFSMIYLRLINSTFFIYPFKSSSISKKMHLSSMFSLTYNILLLPLYFFIMI